jgi:hypothetical protein
MKIAGDSEGAKEIEEKLAHVEENDGEKKSE